MVAAAHPRLFTRFSLPAGAPPLTVAGLLENPIVPGVSAISIGPAKGHTYFDEPNRQMVPVYIDQKTLTTTLAACQVYAGGVRVNAGHFTEICEATGYLNNFRIDGDKLRADWNLFRSFSQFALLCDLIATVPDTFGLSIDFEGDAEVLDAKAYPRVTAIDACDVVPAPAANEGGLFSRRPARRAIPRLVFDSSKVPTIQLH